MNKKQLINEMSTRSDLSKKNIEEVIDNFQQVVCESLCRGEEVKLVGFGRFGIVKREDREGYNPQTKKPMIIKGRVSPNFKAGKTLKEKVNKALS